jgi:hypothetical protein
MKKKLLEIVAAATNQAPDSLMVAGAAGISYGCWMAWAPLGPIVGGTFTLVAGLMWAGSRK